jgi:hypothetical protein
MRYIWEEPMPWMEDDRLATEAEADAEYARNVGYDNPERAWILSDRDVWYRNPAYTGPAVPHPEDHPYEDEQSMDVSFRPGIGKTYTIADIDDEIPF